VKKHGCAVGGELDVEFHVLRAGLYRGDDLPSCVQGRYFFADYCTGQISSFVLEGGAATDVQDGPVAPAMVVGWGRGGDGELYVLGMDGEVFQLTAVP